MSEAVDIDTIELQANPHTPVRPELPMEPEAISEALRTLQNGTRVIVWYKPLEDFDVNAGEFSIDGVELDGDEVDFMVKGMPIVAEIHDALDGDEEWDEGDAATGTFHHLETSVDIEFSSELVEAIWSIQPDSGFGEAISRIDVADSRFTFNALTKTVTLDGEDVEPADLEVLNVKITEHLNNL